MFRNNGRARSRKQHLRLASVLSLVAGMVNVTGFMAVQRLTTNVTGHFAYFVEQVFRFQWQYALVFFLYIFFFFLGSFVSGFLVELIGRKNQRYIYVIPAILESFILFAVAFYSLYVVTVSNDIIACALLFAMGLQNSLVTSISNAIVRTTHLTGLFTDLGIELAQLFFYTREFQKKRLLASIQLRFTIIVFFFFGGIAGGLLYSQLEIQTLYIAGGILLTGIVYDRTKVQIKLVGRKLTHITGRD